MKSSAVDIAGVLTGKHGLVFATNLFVNKEPTTPPNCVTIYPTSGAPTELAYDRAQIRNDNAQIRIRNNNPETGWSLANKIHDELNGMANVQFSGSGYCLHLQVISGPFQLSFDDNGRVIIIINVSLKRR